MSDLMGFLKDLLLWVPLKLWELLLDGLAALLEALPVPGFVQQADSAFSAISGNVLFFAQKFAVGEGISMILAAYVLRFIIRRLPVVG